FNPHLVFFLSSRRRHTRCYRDWSSDVCSSDLIQRRLDGARQVRQFAVGSGIGALLALVQLTGALCLMLLYSPSLTLAFLATTPRSEERRVGKECRTGV